MEGGELRKDPVVDRWVIFSQERARRPHAFPGLETGEGGEDSCPFCPGAEAATPPEVGALGPPGRRPDDAGWQVRIVPNLYPALTPDAGPPGLGGGTREPARGVHEVVVETPDHEARLATLGRARWRELLGVWGERIEALGGTAGVRQVLVYRNEGAEAGATLAHPHAQILGLPRVPREIEDELAAARGSGEGGGTACVFCNRLAKEIEEGTRVIRADENVVVLAPFASRVPYETWILPRRHEAAFPTSPATVVDAVADRLAEWGERMEALLGRFPNNLVLHTAPVGMGNSPRYHWHLELLPRLTRDAAFERGSGWTINPVVPEDAAALLRGDAVA